MYLFANSFIINPFTGLKIRVGEKTSNALGFNALAISNPRRWPINHHPRMTRFAGAVKYGKRRIRVLKRRQECDDGWDE